jgi:DNA-binding transcriptional MerR regulator
VEQKDAKVQNLPAQLDEFLLCRDQHMRALEEAQVALQEATSLAAELDEERERIIERYKTELAEVRSELETRMSELKVVRVQLTDAEDALAKSRGRSWGSL